MTSNSTEKTSEELREEMLKKLQSDRAPQYLQEIAMPGIVQAVDKDKA